MSFTDEGEHPSDVSFVIESADESFNLPSPPLMKRTIRFVSVPQKVCFMDLSQLDKFIKQLNHIRVCMTPGCVGELTPVKVNSFGLGGAVSIKYCCNGCANHEALFETSSKYDLHDTSAISVAIQMAFIVAGCTHTTYYKTLKHALGIDAVHWTTFQSTIECMYPVVLEMVDRMCEEAKTEMKNMDQRELGSWSRAVTSADGTWMTRGFHSKNFTFSIRNYYTGALLFRKHLCQRGRDDLIKEELYQGTSKGAEGYAARLIFKKVKEEGMNIAIHWQDADSSSSNAMTEHFPNAEVMVCGGHAGKAHKKQLEKLSKMKSFTADFRNSHRETFPQVDTVLCHCQKRHKLGCGCLSQAFIEKARNNFSLLLSSSESSQKFAEGLKALPKHSRDQHEWEGGKCSFHALKLCTCGTCSDDEDLKCGGKDYHTRHILKCPLHSLAYEIECHRRASMSEQLVHPIMKRGHSNWLEASHSVFIRFRPKHIHLDRLHYVVSTELALLQSNMTYMYNKRGPQYHWVIELFRRLKLPVFDGVHRALAEFNEQRMQVLKLQQTEKCKKRRISLKIERTKDAQCRKRWSKDHGHDTYGDDENDDLELTTKVESRGKRRQKLSGKKCKACGSTTHMRSSHTECPFNKKKFGEAPIPPLGTADDPSNDSQSDESVVTVMSDSDWCFEDDIINTDMCLCGAGSRAHTKDCPMNSRNRYPSCATSVKGQCNDHSDTQLNTVGNDPEVPRSVKREQYDDIELPLKKKFKPITLRFKAGDYVYLHSDSLINQHMPCRIVKSLGDKGTYQLYCNNGVLNGHYSSKDLTVSGDSHSLSLDRWRQASRVSFRDVASDQSCLEECACNLSKSSETIFLSDNSDAESTQDNVWLRNPLYFLTHNERELVVSRSGWLNDNIISAAQLLMLQHFPHMSGLQPPTLQQTQSFDVHRGEFVQILHVHNSHWCVVSNIGCSDGVVNYYDSLYPSVSSHTMRIIAGLIFSSASDLVVRIMDVGKQSNSSDCGVFAIAFAFDICSGEDPCSVRFDHKLIRQHLAKCLENCRLSRFPTLGKRKSSHIQHIQREELHCSCRLPEEPGDEMAECDSCKVWYHRHCMDIPSEVFNNTDVPWKCKRCESQ